MRSTVYQRFPSTHWSLVRRAGTAAEPEARRQALAVLLTRYLPALRSYLRLVRQIPSADADDLLQAFITDQFLQRDLLARADRSRGRFRTLLLTCLNNFVATRARTAAARTADLLAEPPLADGRVPEPPLAVECAWARALVHEVLEAMREECARTGRPDIWAVFEGRVLAEIFADGTCVSYKELAARLHLGSPGQAANLLVTAKRMYARLLRAAVSEYELEPEDVDAEIADLRRILQSRGDAVEEPSRDGVARREG
jgi:DNA-directed RNA polymerase specialized sigma24 family protein